MEQKLLTLDDIATWRKQLQGYWEEMETFRDAQDIEGVLRKLSAWSSWSGRIHSMIVRSSNKQVTDFRTKEIDHFHDEVDRQFKIWSRIATVSQAEWEMAR